MIRLNKNKGDSPDMVEGDALGIVPSVWNAIWGDATSQERLRFMRIAFRLIVAFHITWACGWLQPFGMSGFAWAKDVQEEISDSHDKILKPINTKLSELDAKVEQALVMQRKLLVNQIAAQLRDLNRMRCKTLDEPTRNRIEADMEEAQTNYRMLVGERYQLSACKDL